jgi:DNA mismatch repair protein MSH3
MHIDASTTDDIATVKATERSLVVIDELGRGTSTHDGVSIAYATLHHIVERIRCCCLFVTHYHVLCDLEREQALRVRNYHMSYLEHAAAATSEAENAPSSYVVRLGVWVCNAQLN